MPSSKSTPFVSKWTRNDYEKTKRGDEIYTIQGISNEFAFIKIDGKEKMLSVMFKIKWGQAKHPPTVREMKVIGKSGMRLQRASIRKRRGRWLVRKVDVGDRAKFQFAIRCPCGPIERAQKFKVIEQWKRVR